MVKKRGRTEEAKVNTPIEELNTKETITHYNAMLLEEQQSMFRLVHERMDAMCEHFDRKFEQIDKRFEQIDKRFEQIDKRFEQVDKRFEQVDRKIDALRDDMMDMERRICSKINRITDRCERHECRLDALEAG